MRKAQYESKLKGESPKEMTDCVYHLLMQGIIKIHGAYVIEVMVETLMYEKKDLGLATVNVLWGENIQEEQSF